MPITPFLDSLQIEILRVLDEKRDKDTSQRGVPGRELQEQLQVEQGVFRALVDDLVEREFVKELGRNWGNPLGNLLITAAGRDYIAEYTARPREAAQAHKRWFRIEAWTFGRAVVLLAIAAVFTALAMYRFACSP